MQPVLKFAGESFEKDGVRLVILSNETKDRDGDVVRASGWNLANFAKAPRLMSCHEYGRLTSQIGEWRNVHVDASLKALVGEPVYYVNQGNPEADWGAYLASIGQATYSVGFAPETSSPMKGGGFEFTSQELLECSHVPIPSNPDALQLMAKAFRARSGEPEQPERRPAATLRRLHKSSGESQDYIRQRVEDALQDAYPYQGGYDYWCGPMMRPDADGPGCYIRDLYADAVIVSDQDFDALWEIPYTLEANGDVTLDQAGAHLVKVTYTPLSMSSEEAQKQRTKAGRVISASNMDKLHSALGALHSVHDATCDTADCPMGDGGTKAVNAASEGDGRIQVTSDSRYHERADSGVLRRQGVLNVRAASEGSASEGGVTVGEQHGAFDGTHSHAHSAMGGQGDDASHDHEHSHDGSGSHGHEHKSAEPVETKQPTPDEITAAAQARADAFSAAVEAATTKALEAAGW